ncbi:MAG: polysaccharide deacetylase family protein [Chitinophagaceae bacterium]|nr:polysaccharide deacetylase family protein [Chitinophagaceae bacterium]
MLNFRNTNIVFIVLLAALTGCHILYGLPFYSYIILSFVYSLLLFWGSYFIGSNFYFNVICSAKTEQKQIAISFDDGPFPEFTPQVLQILKENKVPAAFFCIGKRVQEHAELFQQVIAEGHLIGNHSYSHHLWFDLFSAGKMAADLQAMDDAMKKIAGLKPRLFRPPYGVTNPNLKKAVIKGNYIPIGWNIRSMDTVIKNEQKLLEKVTRLLKPGAVVLFHDTAKATPGMLSAFIRQVKDSGYEIVRLDKLLKLEPYA